MQKTQEPYKTFGYYLPRDVAAKLRKRARKNRRSASSELAFILSKILSRKAA